MMALKVDVEGVEGHPDILVVYLEGDLDTYTADILREEFSNFLKRYRKFAVVMEGVGYVSSMGWGVLSQAIYKARARGGDIVLVNLKPKVERIFRIMGFSSLFKHYEDLDRAVKYLVKGNHAI